MNADRKATIAELLAQDRQKLLMKLPFTGSLVMRLDLVPVSDERLPTAATDGDRIFARQLEAFGQDGDVLVVFSADGQSQRLAEAARTAREQGMFILGATGGDGGTLSAEDLLDVELRVPSIEESLVQELHVAIACLLSELCDYYLYTKPEILREMFQAGAGIPGDGDAGGADSADPAEPAG